MDREKYQEDLRDIKEIMDRSSRFLSLSGLSGVVVGVIALVAALLAQRWVLGRYGTPGFKTISLEPDHMLWLLAIAFTTLVLSIGSVLLLTGRETRKKGQKPWDFQTKRILINLAIPLVTGGIICLLLLLNGFLSVLPPLTLIFYGLALVNTSKYTVDEIRSLGLIEIGLGLIGMFLLPYGLLIWALGFGLLHIIYGIIAHRKYNS